MSTSTPTLMSSRLHKRRRRHPAEADCSGRPIFERQGKRDGGVSRVAAADCDGFLREELSGKSAHARFSALIAKHRKSQQAARTASGVEEEYSETVQLLDDLVERLDGLAEEQEATAEQQQKKEERQSEADQAVRVHAMQRMNGTERSGELALAVSCRVVDRQLRRRSGGTSRQVL